MSLGSQLVDQTTSKKWAAVGLLAIALSISIMDRTIINLLIQPIKASLHLSDTQIAVMNGVCFGLPYCVFALFLGRLADKGNRRNIILFSILGWSIVIILTGFARNFAELASCRAALALSEAALVPAGFSMITEMFPREKLGRAISLFYAGSSLGPGLALIYGGAILALTALYPSIALPVYGKIADWQIVLIAAGLPGFVVAALLLIVLREPRRGVDASPRANGNSIFGGVEYVWKNCALYGPLFIALIMLAIGFIATMTWAPTYLIRSYGWSPRSVGLILGTIVGLGGFLGSLSGGWLADWLTTHGRRDGLVLSMTAMGTLCGPFAFSVAPMIGAYWMLAGLFFYNYFFLGMTSTAPAIMQIMTPSRLRAQISAFYLSLSTIATMAAAPLFVALLTDYAFKDPKALGLSLVSVSAVSVPISLCALWVAKRSFRSVDWR